jgi:hypothetical protein
MNYSRKGKSLYCPAHPMMAAPEDITAWRHTLTSRPATLTSPPQHHPRRHAGELQRSQHLQTRNDWPHQPGPTRHANLSQLSAPSRSGWPHRPEVTVCGKMSCSAAGVPSPIYKPHVFMSLSLSLYSRLVAHAQYISCHYSTRSLYLSVISALQASE